MTDDEKLSKILPPRRVFYGLPLRRNLNPAQAGFVFIRIAINNYCEISRKNQTRYHRKGNACNKNLL